MLFLHLPAGPSGMGVAETAEQRKALRSVPSGNGAVQRGGDAAPEAGHRPGRFRPESGKRISLPLEAGHWESDVSL